MTTIETLALAVGTRREAQAKVRWTLVKANQHPSRRATRKKVKTDPCPAATTSAVRKTKMQSHTSPHSNATHTCNS